MAVYGAARGANFARAIRSRTFPAWALERAYPDASLRAKAENVLRRNGWDKSYSMLDPRRGAIWYRVLGVD